MNDITPYFSSHYSRHRGILTLEPAGKTAATAAASIVDLCLANNLKDCMLVETTLGGAYEASRNLAASGINLHLGYKVVVCEDEKDKSEKSISTESKIIIFPKDSDNGWAQLVRIANHASTEGFYYVPRTSWRQLKELWTDDLVLALPFFSSFVARNTLTLNHVVPDLPVSPTILREIDSGLPFAPLIDAALDRFNIDKIHPEDKIKTIYYPTKDRFKQYITYRAKLNRTTFVKPNIDHLASDNFCMSEWRRLSNAT